MLSGLGESLHPLGNHNSIFGIGNKRARLGTGDEQRERENVLAMQVCNPIFSGHGTEHVSQDGIRFKGFT